MNKLNEIIEALQDLRNELADNVICEHEEVDWENDVYADPADYDERIETIEKCIQVLRDMED